MKTKHTSYAFLMEMMWVCAFFLISACIFVLVFAKSERISRDAEILNRAVQAASNAMEDTFALYEETMDSPAADDTVRDLAMSYGTEEYDMEIEHRAESSFLSVTVKIISKQDHSEIYSLTGSRFLAGISDSAKPKEGVTP